MTREQAAKWIPILAAYAEGKTIEWLFEDRDWTVKPIGDYWFDNPPERYRVKVEPKLRPWRPEEVPVGKLIITKSREGSATPSLILDCGNHKISFVWNGRLEIVSLDEAFWNCEHSTDGGKTWLPCGVMEVA